MKYEVLANTDKKTNATVSKTLITLLMLIAMAGTGFLSYQLFEATQYDISNLLTIASYFSIVLGIYALTMSRKPKYVH